MLLFLSTPRSDAGSAPSAVLGHTPSTAGTFRKKFWKNSGKTPETLSEHFLEFPSRVRLGSPKHYNSRHLKAPEHFQNCLPPSTAGDASFFRSGSGEGLSEPVMEFPAVLGVFLTFGAPPSTHCALGPPPHQPGPLQHQKKSQGGGGKREGEGWGGKGCGLKEGSSRWGDGGGGTLHWTKGQWGQIHIRGLSIFVLSR